MTNKTEIYYSSTEGEMYTCGSYDEAYEEFLQEYDSSIINETGEFSEEFLDENPTIELFEEEFTCYPASRYLSIDEVVENSSVHAQDQVYSEDFDWLYKLSEQQETDLKVKFGKAFDEWATEHNLQPNFSESNYKSKSILVKPLTPTTFEIINK